MTFPLWLPRGSVRAILALIIVTVGAYKIVVSEVDDPLYLLLAAVLGGYGLMRKTDDEPPLIVDHIGPAEDVGFPPWQDLVVGKRHGTTVSVPNAPPDNTTDTAEAGSPFSS
jgi:hypothetical protein